MKKSQAWVKETKICPVDSHSLGFTSIFLLCVEIFWCGVGKDGVYLPLQLVIQMIFRLLLTTIHYLVWFCHSITTTKFFKILRNMLTMLALGKHQFQPIRVLEKFDRQTDRHRVGCSSQGKYSHTKKITVGS